MIKSEEQYFNWLYTDTYPLLKRYVCNKAGSSEADDILQETYYQAYKNIQILKGHTNPTGWLMVTCKNILLKHMAKNGEILKNTYIGDSEDVMKNISVMDNYDHLYMEELSKILSDDVYFLLVKKYVEGYSIEELALQLNIADGACKMRLRRAKKEAQKKIKLLFMLLFSLFKDYI